jgi:serine/threonine-protein kinase RsbW
MQPEILNPHHGTDRLRVLVLDRDPTQRDALVTAFLDRGHTVTPIDSVEEAEHWISSNAVDLVVTDLGHARSGNLDLIQATRNRRAPLPLVISASVHDEDTLRTLRGMAADILQRPLQAEEIDRVVEKAHAYHLRHHDAVKVRQFMRERIEFLIPSRVEYLDAILSHLAERMIKYGIISSHTSNVLIALDEAIVNAIKHGNSYDESKTVSIVAEVSKEEASFTIGDQGTGFRREDVPDPCAPENLLRPSGRGLLLIQNIMDEMCYNEAGNSLFMRKRAEPPEA